MYRRATVGALSWGKLVVTRVCEPITVTEPVPFNSTGVPPEFIKVSRAEVRVPSASTVASTTSGAVPRAGIKDSILNVPPAEIEPVLVPELLGVEVVLPAEK